MSDRAAAAYVAYAEVVGWKNFRGDPMPPFNDLPELIKQAWDGACEGALQHWLENDFRDAANDYSRVEKHAGRMLKIGQDRGDSAVECIRIALASFVIDCITPDVFEDTRKQLREQGESDESNRNEGI